MYRIVSKYLPVCNQLHGPIIADRLTVIQLVKKFLAFYEKGIHLISELPTNLMHASSSSIWILSGKITELLFT